MNEITTELLNRNGITKVGDSIELIRQLAPIKDKKELDIILLIISRIKQNDEDFNSYSFRINDLVEFYNSNNPYDKKSRKSIINTIDNLMNIRNIFIDNQGNEVKFIWFPSAIIDKDKKTVTLKINEDLKRFLLQTDNIVVYQLEKLLKLDFRPAMLYRWSYTYKDCIKKYGKIAGKQIVPISYLKEMFGMGEKEIVPKAFAQRYLKPAVQQINEMSDLYIEYKTLRGIDNTETKYEFYIYSQYIKKEAKQRSASKIKADKEKNKAMWQELLELKEENIRLKQELKKERSDTNEDK